MDNDDDEPHGYDARGAAKRARVASPIILESAAAGPNDATTTATAAAYSSRTTTSSSSFRPRPRVPPDPSRYVALWNGADDHDRGRDDKNAAASSLSAMLDELDLAHHNQQIWERIDALQRTINDCEAEIDQLRQELDGRTAKLPRLIDDRIRNRSRFYWNVLLPDQLKHDTAFALALVRGAAAAEMPDPVPITPAAPPGEDDHYKDDDDDEDEEEYVDYYVPQGRYREREEEMSFLPFPFQKMLWSDSNCPLRNDRQLLLASLDKGLDTKIDILWTPQIENDRELLIKIFQTCPWGLDHEVGIPDRVLNDPELIRAFAESSSLRRYRQTLVWSGEDHVVCRFSLDAWEHPTLLAKLMRQCVETKNKDKWAHKFVRRQLEFCRRPTEDYVRLAVAVAEEMSCVPQKEYVEHCPLLYSNLDAPGLTRSRELVLAFIPLDPTVTHHVHEELRNDVELWQAAVQCTPRYANIPIPAPSPDFASKLFYLLFLEDAKVPLKDPLVMLLRSIRSFPDATAKDRDFTIKHVCMLAEKKKTHWNPRIGTAFENDRDFWMELALEHRCDVSAWHWVPEPIQGDPAVIWAWARHAKDMNAAWLASKIPELNLLSDRQVLINCLPPIWSNRSWFDEERRKIWSHVESTILDYSLWLELVSRCEGDGLNRLLPDNIRDDHAIVRARLRSTMKNAEAFADLFCRALSLDVQLQHLDVLLEVIQGMKGKGFFNSVLYERLDMGVLHVPEVALALLSKGWHVNHHQFDAAVNSAPWSDDPEFLLVVAERQLIPAFEAFCPEILRSDKELILNILKVDSRHWNALDGEVEDEYVGVHKYDFDVLMCVLGLSPDRILSRIPPLDSESRRQHSACAFPTEMIVDFAREVRHRLTLQASIETVMMGTCSHGEALAAAAPTYRVKTPLSLLDQDCYTKRAFRSRLTELLGASLSDDDVASFRRVSNALSRYGF